jgi:predicted dehydrogenase
VVCTPNETHFPLAKRCLEAGRDVVVDKPFTTSVKEALELFRIARENARRLTVYHNRRFDADFQALRQVVDSGVLGDVVRFENTYDRFRPAPKANAWREKPGPGSGVLFDLAPHLVDQAFTLFGRPEAVWADVRMERQNVRTDDAFDLYLYYSKPKGFRVQLKAAMLCATPRPRLIALGTRGSFVKNDFDPLENALRNGSVPRGDDWMLEKEENWAELTLVEEGGNAVSRVPSQGDWRQFYANVRDAILGKATILVTPQQCMDVMVALELVQESSAKRCAVAWRDVHAGA